MTEDYRLAYALRCHDSGRLAEAIDLLTLLLGEDPNVALYHGLLASSLLGQKRLEAAEYELSAAFALDPTLPFLHLVQARLSLLHRRIPQAQEACDEALRLEPTLVDAHLFKAALFQLDERPRDARACLEAAAQHEPDNEAVLCAFGDYHKRSGDLDEAYRYAQDALRINAGSEAANVLMGEVQLARGNAEEAEHHAKFAIMQNPNSESALRLFVDIRTRRNWFIGTWWRVNSWLATLESVKAALVLIGAYLFFNLATEVAEDLGSPALSSLFSYGWLVIVIYSWVAIPIYQRALKKELDEFRFKPDTA